MSQTTLLSDWFDAAPLPPIPGLRYLPAYIDAALERELIARVDAMPWSTDWRRRVQVYGLGYGDDVPPPPLPDWLVALGRRVARDGLIERDPENAVINEYVPGVGIAAHRDYAPFGPTIVGISLGAPCVMDFLAPEPGTRHALVLEPRSALVLGGEARSSWKHGIAARRSDLIAGTRVARERRLSVTFRTAVNARA